MRLVSPDITSEHSYPLDGNKKKLEFSHMQLRKPKAVRVVDSVHATAPQHKRDKALLLLGRVMASTPIGTGRESVRSRRQLGRPLEAV